MIRTAAAIAAIFLVSCTYAPRSTNQTYTARQMAIGVTSQPTGGMTSTTTVGEAPASGDTIPSPQQHLATYPEVRVAELASKPTISHAISSASNFITIGSTKSDVVRIQGTPTKIADLSFINQEMWNYGYYNRITFKNGRVSEWNNSDGKLKVRMEFE